MSRDLIVKEKCVAVEAGENDGRKFLGGMARYQLICVVI